LPCSKGGVPYGWDVRLNLTWEAFTLDLRDCDTNFTKAEYKPTRRQGFRPPT
jgi:hypothetical protein